MSGVSRTACREDVQRVNAVAGDQVPTDSVEIDPWKNVDADGRRFTRHQIAGVGGWLDRLNQAEAQSNLQCEDGCEGVLNRRQLVEVPAWVWLANSLQGIILRLLWHTVCHKLQIMSSVAMAALTFLRARSTRSCAVLLRSPSSRATWS